MELSEHLEWCTTSPDTGIAQVAAGGCTFTPATMASLAPGFSKQAFWLRITLRNPSTQKAERWLRVGHPRLQYVSLFMHDQQGGWQRSDTGIGIPLARRPIATANPVLPLQLAGNDNQTLFIRVLSKTTIDLSATLWQQDAYVAAHHHIELIQTLSLGGLATIVLLTLMAYLNWRDRLYLYFAACILAMIVFDACYTGLMQVHFLASNRTFDYRWLLILPGIVFTFLALFLREFVGDERRYRAYYLGLFGSVCALLLAVMWGSVVDFAEAVRFVYLGGLAVFFSCIALLFHAMRNGSKPAGYMLAAFSIWLPMFGYRMAVAFGFSNFADANHAGYSWRFIIVTPIILAAIHLRTEKLREAIRQAAARVQFMAQMSHEFRTPLNTILGYAELLERESSRVTPQESATAIKRSGRYLLGMIDEILDHARGDAGTLCLHLEPVCWPDFINALKQSAELLTRTHGNRFHLRQDGDIPQTLMLDERRFRQVLDILLSNANRYTRHGEITLVCSGVPCGERRTRLTLSVTDTGTGIGPNELALIFQPFARGSAGKNSGIDGVGIGLTVAQQLLKLMGGTISVDSIPDRGSRFWFEIECELAETEAATPTTSPRTTVKHPHTILLVDDDPQSLDVISMLLADYGFHIITAKSGNGARQYLDTEVDLVITDQFMEDGDGWSVLQDWSARHVPVILLSAAPPQVPAEKRLTVQFARIQLKPLDADALLLAIDETLTPEWAFAAPSTAPAPTKRPPIAQLTQLQSLIDAGAVTDIEEWLKAFVGRNPEYRDYCAKLAACNLALDFSSMRALLVEAVPDSPPK